MFRDISRRIFLRRTFRDVEKFGWTGMYAPGDADQASLFYSVGLWRSKLGAEIVIFGVDPESGHSLLHDAQQQFDAGTLRFEDGAAWDVDWDSIGQVRLRWCAVHPSQIIPLYFDAALAHMAHRKHPPSSLRAYQLVFPDTSGKFPWEDAFDREYRPRQPELYLPRIDRGRSGLPRAPACDTSSATDA